MKIAILGTRGVPKNYGGFEQAAQNLAIWFTKYGHKVTVYNPDTHPYQEKVWNNIQIRRIFSREDKLGEVGSMIYDFLCLRDAIKNEFDILLELGVPAAIFYFLKPKNRILVTNIDGLEWKRSKWNQIIKRLYMYLEVQSVKKSTAIITDNPYIQKYVIETYGENINSSYIGYGVEDTVFKNPDENTLGGFGVKKYSYYLMINRLEPENNIEPIIDGYLKSSSGFPLLIVARHNVKYRKFLINKYRSSKSVKFLGGIYGKDNLLNNLRYYCKCYFHGHSVGGTNPSLIEAMSGGAYIAAHNNQFNEYVLGENGVYFSDANDVKNIIKNFDESKRESFRKGNFERINNEFNWKSVSEKHIELFDKILTSSKLHV